MVVAAEVRARPVQSLEAPAGELPRERLELRLGEELRDCLSRQEVLVDDSEGPAVRLDRIICKGILPDNVM